MNIITMIGSASDLQIVVDALIVLGWTAILIAAIKYN
jgi:hypothetical protein